MFLLCLVLCLCMAHTRRSISTDQRLAQSATCLPHLVDVLADLVEHRVRLIAQRVGCFLQYFLQRAHLCVKLLHHEALSLQGQKTTPVSTGMVRMSSVIVMHWVRSS